MNMQRGLQEPPSSKFKPLKIGAASRSILHKLQAVLLQLIAPDREPLTGLAARWGSCASRAAALFGWL